MGDHRRHLTHDQSTFGDDQFGRLAERFARFFGTPKFIIAQSGCVAVWIVAGALLRFDPWPYIALNLLFSTQAAYAAPLILLAQTRQTDRDKAQAEADARHREEVAQAHEAQLRTQAEGLAANTALTAQVHELTQQIHAAVAIRGKGW